MASETIKVLLVEDNLGEARLLYAGIDKAFPGQFQMTHVKRLAEALEFLSEDSCSVVLLDLGLPDSHGLETLLRVRAEAPGVPIVVLTGFQDEEMGEQALLEGAQDYLVKGQANSKLLVRSLRYAIVRKVAEQALLERRVALARADELQRSRQRLAAGHERVRRSVACQLREELGQDLAAVAASLQEVLTVSDPTSETARIVSEVIDLLHRMGEQQIGALGRQLYPEKLAFGLASSLRALGSQLDAAVAVEISLDEDLLDGEETGRPLFGEPVGLAIYRIAEEAMNNVAKHAKAKNVTLRLDPLRQGWWQLQVRDDGQGFDLSGDPRGLGIPTFYDYARALGGECVIQSAPHAGTEVTVALPLTPAEAPPIGVWVGDTIAR